MFPQEKSRHHRIKKIIIGAIVVPVVLFILLIIYSFVANVFYRSDNIKKGNYDVINQPVSQSNTPKVLYSEQKKKLVEGLGNQTFGAENPKVTIVEFADFACPYCKASFTSLREVSTLYKDKVKLIFRDWPGHTNSVSLAMAAHCAGEQGKFWEMHDKLYANQSETFGADKNDLATLASELGIYNDQFQTCFDNQKYLSRIQKDIVDGETLGVIGTPTWFFNGEKVEGELTKLDLEKIIKQYDTQ